MEKLFVPYELAMLAKEKGFDELCLAYYAGFDEEQIIHYTSYNLQIQHNSESLFCVYVPLYQQLVDWFREVHKIHISVFTNDNNTFWVDFEYLDRNEAETICCDKDYYKALDKALLEAFKLI